MKAPSRPFTSRSPEEHLQKGSRFLGQLLFGPESLPEGVFLKSSVHPRAYGSFARLLAKYVRDEKIIALEEAVRKLTALPAENLRLDRRGRLKENYFADVVVFDPAKVQDHATDMRNRTSMPPEWSTSSSTASKCSGMESTPVRSRGGRPRSGGRGEVLKNSGARPQRGRYAGWTSDAPRRTRFSGTWHFHAAK